MKVFFQATFKENDEYINLYQKIYEELAHEGYQHVDNDVVATGQKELYQSLNKGDVKTNIALYERKTHAIQNADICIFEATTAGLGLGFLIEKALGLSKPTIVLYLHNVPPVLLTGVQSEKLILKSYDEKNLKRVLKEALSSARERRDKRFNFFLSPKLLDYLEETSKKEDVTKSKLIRDMIVEHMRKDSS
ncbi:hypothetical protein A3F03_04115 [Candidatus Roizmanbacteria bacterium RIFCSPHIGHO2_12_FULL_41_11]|uniref:Ribbon-helix-helix protein CopG domain-containing protein n=2 Tax=Candidatus Roizmaniibacteriota TaxID=1752723 RepID=A0A1F7J8T4_9BACT|nr:MAG: hypothetical protein A3F03_04115 [Candidatus Roizmanbacteria bacterium RIFCSPHIGHO2_12_FULL_41_11]OGK51986.1 MAG: hypothetical protein A2966_04250 [Candidatus Roizmanbacteria bacterium RIFCSPLOWO2_01_FULL_41_22]